jgi:hypothetical protein
MNFELGDVLKLVKSIYAHYAVCLGAGHVLEFSGDRAKDLATARVRVSTFEEFSAGQEVRLAYRPTTAQLSNFQARVDLVLNRTDYSLLHNNCEHIARFVATGEKVSTQVRAAAFVAGAIALWNLLSDDDEEGTEAIPSTERAS